MKFFIRIALLATLLPTMSYAEDAHKHTEHVKAEHVKVSGVEALSPELRGLLSEEMKALQAGMISIIPAYISGNWSEIETTAQKIKSSYILKKSLTEKVRKPVNIQGNKRIIMFSIFNTHLIKMMMLK